MNKENTVSFIKFAICFFTFYFFMALLYCYTTSSPLIPVVYDKYHVSCALLFSLICALWNFDKKSILVSSAVVLFWVGAVFCKIGASLVLSEFEVVQTVIVGIVVYASFYLLWYCIAESSDNGILKRVLKCFTLILLGISVLPALLVLGYYVVSGGRMLSSNILLTLFQTNYNEVVSYLAEQNMLLWTVSVLALILILGALIYFADKIGNKRSGLRIFALNIVFLAYVIVYLFPRLISCSVVNMIIQLQVTLNEYRKYNAVSQHRQERLSALKENIRYDDISQLHVLVLGESVTNRHLSTFGYKRPTTPWLDEILKENSNIILYTNAYSNDVQTVRSLQYALTSHNQYDNSVLADAYAITEVAMAADYNTYWISNQMHEIAFDNPISTIASGAEYRIFINDYLDNRHMTEYHDAKLAEYFPTRDDNKKVLVIFHLMGCHITYTDRYPKSYELFTGSDDERIDYYDNCVRYNDHVLSLLYQKAVEHPHFMSFTFLSDHGEDPDNGLTHDYSKFTWNMAHIPFFSIFSDKYVNLHPDVVKNMRDNRTKYWTSDLLYNTMMHVMGIENAPGENDEYDISSEKYNMNRDNLTIVEGLKFIKDDDSE